MKNVKKITLVLAVMLFVGLWSQSNSAYAQRCAPGGSVGIYLPRIGLQIDDFGVSLRGPHLNIDTRGYPHPSTYNRYNRYSYPPYNYRDPNCRPPYSTYPRYDYRRQPYVPTYPRYDYRNQYDSRRYEQQLRKQREYQERIRREQERYQRNMDRLLRDLNRDCR